jgi:hypothetical protein
MACDGVEEYLGAPDSASYALPMLPSLVDATLRAHLTHPGPLARVASQEKTAVMRNRVHVFGYAGDGITRGG